MMTTLTMMTTNFYLQCFKPIISFHVVSGRYFFVTRQLLCQNWPSSNWEREVCCRECGKINYQTLMWLAVLVSTILLFIFVLKLLVLFTHRTCFRRNVLYSKPCYELNTVNTHNLTGSKPSTCML